MRSVLGVIALVSLAGAAVVVEPSQSHAQTRPAVPPQTVAVGPPAPRPITAPPPQPVLPEAKPSGLLAAISLSDIGFANGFRFANLGGRREVFIPLPQGSDVALGALEFVIDDISAHEAKRTFEVLLNDRSVLAVSLDGKSQGRILRMPLRKIGARDGFVKLTLLYSGAATPDRCIDVRSVGDSLTIRPESAVEIEIGQGAMLDVTATATLMPRNVAVVLPAGRLAPTEIATALTVGRTMLASGRRVKFHQGYDKMSSLVGRSESNRWTQSVVVIGSLDKVAGLVDEPVTVVAGPPMVGGALSAIRVAGTPALLISDGAAGRLLASPLLSAARGVASASVGDVVPVSIASNRVTFDRLGVEPVQADVFGRAELMTAVDLRRLPAARVPSRLLLDVMVAPDGAGEKAVLSAYINDRLLGSTVAQTNGATRLDLSLPEGLIGARMNVRVVVQRPSAQGDCRLEPQGYPAQILESSSFELAASDGRVSDFSDLASLWNNGIEVLLPRSSADRPANMLGFVARLLNAFSPEAAPVTVRLQTPESFQAPSASFIAVGMASPPNSTPRARFDRGRVAVADRSGRTLLDLAEFTSGTVVQVVNSGEQPGLWVRPFADDGSLPEPDELKLDRGDVAFVDRNSVALAMSTERDTLIQLAYPDQVSWLAVAERFRPWIIASLWLLATLGLLVALRRMLRRRPSAAIED